MLGIIKGDIRYDELSKMVDSVISSELCDFLNIDSLLLPFNGIDEYYNIKQSNLNLLDILKENDIKTIFVGNANNKLKELCNVKNIKLYELLKMPEFVIDNAFLTAIGLVAYLNQKSLAITDQKILIIGFGNIGFELAKVLKAYKCEFSVYPNTSEEEKFVRLLGYKIADFNDFDIAVNTIPRILEWDYSIFKTKRVIDVASAPYGFDINEIYKNDIKYEIVSAIPSKFAPTSAAIIIKKHIANLL